MANNDLLYNAAIEGICSGASRASTDVTGTIYDSINTIAERLATAIDTAIAPIADGANTSQAALLKGICEGVYRYSWPSDTALDLTQQVDAIVTQFVAQQALLLPIAPSGGGVSPQPREYWVNNNADPVGVDGSIAHPFTTFDQAMVALIADPIAEHAVLYMAPSAVPYDGTVERLWPGVLSVNGDGDSGNVSLRGINLPNSTVCIKHCGVAGAGTILVESLRSYDSSIMVDVTVSHSIRLFNTIVTVGLSFTCLSPTDNLYVDHTSNYWLVTKNTDIVGLTKLLMAIDSGGAGRNAIPYVTYVDAHSTSTATPDGSYNNPFLTVHDAVAATEASPLAAPSVQRVIYIAPGTYGADPLTFQGIQATREAGNLTFVGMGSKASDVLLLDWTINFVSSGGLWESGELTFQDLVIRSSGGGEDMPYWDMHCFNWTCLRCQIALGSSGTVRQAGTDSEGREARFEKCSVYSWPEHWEFTGLMADYPARVLLDGLSAATRPLPTIVGNPVKSVRNAIPKNPGQYWVNNAEDPAMGEQLGCNYGIDEQGTIAYPFRTLQAAIDRIVALGETRATIYLAASGTYYSATTDSTNLCYLKIKGEGHVPQASFLSDFNAPAWEVELESVYVFPGPIVVAALNLFRCELHNVNITINDGFTIYQTKLTQTTPFTYTALMAGTVLVDAFTNFYFIPTAPVLVDLTKTLIFNNTP